MSNGTKYYGGFFWVAAVSFIVPLFVGWHAFQNLQPATKPTPSLDKSGVDHNAWNYLLNNYVANGLVDYDGMKKDYLFHEYMRQLGTCDPQLLDTDDERLALACNAYNAFVINGVISHKVDNSVMLVGVEDKDSDEETPDAENSADKPKEPGFFDFKEHVFAGQTISLNKLEHEMIRPTFKEPRVHVALVCGAKGCPSIRPQAYNGQCVRDQLQDQSTLFVNDPKHVMYDPATNELKLNSILSWYGVDFNERYPNGGYLAWINKLATDQTIKDAAIKAINKEVSVSFLDYDWALNTQARGKSGKVGGFGSGSSPDE